jgi:tRNA U34 5-methylaminomethyl-2-thiouridine-forming methyltransferase MnmC
MKNNLRIISSNDGSHTIYREDIDEHYHSIHGSIQESIHVFIEAGLKTFIKKNKKKEINILEIGFGTGLNALLTNQETKQLKQIVNYHTLEPLPIEYSLIKNLNFKKINSKVFSLIHNLEWNCNHSINNFFTFFKEKITFEDFNSKIKYDIIYYDAFGPNSQKEMWTLDVFEKLYSLLNSSGILVTYCAKGQVRRDLKSVGFEMERLPGPIGKREMLRASKI